MKKILQVLTNSAREGCGIIEVVQTIISHTNSSGHETDTISVGEVGFMGFTVPYTRRVNVDQMKAVQKLHQHQSYDVVHIHGAFHHAKIARNFKVTNPDVTVILTIHVHSDIGRSAYLSRINLIEALEAGVKVDFINPDSVIYFNSNILESEDERSRFDRVSDNALSNYNCYNKNDESKVVKTPTEDAVLYLGRIDKGKGTPSIMSMFSSNGIKLHMYGKISEDYSDEYYGLLNSTRTIEYKGFVKPEELSDIIGKYKAIILTTPSENTSLVMIRSLVLGVPVIIDPTCRGNRFYLGMLFSLGIPELGNWYRKSLPTRSREISRVVDLVNSLKPEDRIALSSEARKLFSRKTWLNNISLMYKLN